MIPDYRLLDFDLVALTVILLANYIQIAEEWKSRGITDTSFKVLTLLITGPAILIYTRWNTSEIWVLLWFAGLSLFACCLFFIKLRDLGQTKFKILR
jgi:hypothetical protein